MKTKKEINDLITNKITGLDTHTRLLFIKLIEEILIECEQDKELSRSTTNSNNNTNTH